MAAATDRIGCCKFGSEWFHPCTFAENKSVTADVAGFWLLCGWWWWQQQNNVFALIVLILVYRIRNANGPALSLCVPPCLEYCTFAICEWTIFEHMRFVRHNRKKEVFTLTEKYAFFTCAFLLAINSVRVCERRSTFENIRESVIAWAISRGNNVNEGNAQQIRSRKSARQKYIHWHFVGTIWKNICARLLCVFHCACKLYWPSLGDFLFHFFFSYFSLWLSMKSIRAKSFWAHIYTFFERTHKNQLTTRPRTKSNRIGYLYFWRTKPYAVTEAPRCPLLQTPCFVHATLRPHRTHAIDSKIQSHE